MEIAAAIRDTSRAEALADYENLKAAPAPDEPDRKHTGLKTLDYFFLHHRIKTKTRRHISFYEALQQPAIKRQLTQLLPTYQPKDPSTMTPTEKLKALYRVFQLYYGTVNQFRPTVAKWVYGLLRPRTRILDISAGWGGRLLAAMSMGIPYYGIDANKRLEVSYRRMVEMCEPDATPVQVQLQFKPAEEVDFGRLPPYDLIFTSPPYFMIEEYQGMPQYGSKQAFLEQFFIPVTMRAWEHLQPGGNMALNMPEEMYEAIAPHLPRIKRRLELPLSNRHPTNTVKQQARGTEDVSRHEWIYVWHKQRPRKN